MMSIQSYGDAQSFALRLDKIPNESEWVKTIDKTIYKPTELFWKEHPLWLKADLGEEWKIQKEGKTVGGEYSFQALMNGQIFKEFVDPKHTLLIVPKNYSNNLYFDYWLLNSHGHKYWPIVEIESSYLHNYFKEK